MPVRRHHVLGVDLAVVQVPVEEAQLVHEHFAAAVVTGRTEAQRQRRPSLLGARDHLKAAPLEDRPQVPEQDPNSPIKPK